MKYYCKNCKSVIETERDISGLQACYICGWRFNDGYEEIIPDYEMPEQYEKRTGKAYPDNGAVWYRRKEYDSDSSGVWSVWKLVRYDVREYYKPDQIQVVIADPTTPPPDDWRTKTEYDKYYIYIGTVQDFNNGGGEKHLIMTNKRQVETFCKSNNLNADAFMGGDYMVDDYNNGYWLKKEANNG